MVSIHIGIIEKSLSNFDSNPIGYQTKQTVEEPKAARSLLDSRVKDSTNSSLYGKTGLSIVWKSKISEFYGLTANDDKTLASFPLSLQRGKRAACFR